MVTRGRLEVSLIDACDLRKTFFGRMRPYVLIQYGNQNGKSTIAKGHGPRGRRTREWNETLMFDSRYPDAEEEEHKYKLTLVIMNKRSCCSKDHFVGETTIYVKDVVSLGTEKGKAELRPTKYRVVLRNKNYHGEIKVGVTFIKKVEDVIDKDLGGWKQSLISE